MRRALLAALLWGLVAIPRAWAEEQAPRVEIRVTAEAPKATVGDRLRVRVQVLHPAGITISEPVPIAGNESSLVLESVKPPASQEKTEKDVFYYQLQAFEPGMSHIPAFRVPWRTSSGVEGAASSEPVPLEIVSVLKGPQDAPADLKPPAEIPGPPFPWRWAVLVAALVLAAAAAAIAWMRRKRPLPAGVPLPAVPALPAHEQAYRDLELLLAGSLLREGKIKQFHVELSEIVKRYVGARFDIDAMERTSEEVLRDLKNVRVGVEPMGAAREFFGATDLVKFAKLRPAEDEIRRSVDRAYRIVDLTKLAPEAPQPAGGGAPSPVSAEMPG
ncbi:MAG TPA: hypothetical protein VGR38_08350 [Candidatus Polarisedimenticolia bacterium]|jgi:hypothetical protein|nr:hypothetical protein [Candidatus Polarisedimenticolia bacterium]